MSKYNFVIGDTTALYEVLTAIEAFHFGPVEGNVIKDFEGNPLFKINENDSDKRNIEVIADEKKYPLLTNIGFTISAIEHSLKKGE